MSFVINLIVLGIASLSSPLVNAQPTCQSCVILKLSPPVPNSPNNPTIPDNATVAELAMYMNQITASLNLNYAPNARPVISRPDGSTVASVCASGPQEDTTSVCKSATPQAATTVIRALSIYPTASCGLTFTLQVSNSYSPTHIKHLRFNPHHAHSSSSPVLSSYTNPNPTPPTHTHRILAGAALTTPSPTVLLRLHHGSLVLLHPWSPLTLPPRLVLP